MASVCRTKLCIFFLLSVILAAFCGCTKNDDEFIVEFFSVKGCVFDDATDAPISGITIEMKAYSLDDPGKGNPLQSFSCFSSEDGTYQFLFRSSDNISEMYFVFSLSDSSTYRESHYQPMERELFLNNESANFNSSMKIYVVEGNDFRLLPEN